MEISPSDLGYDSFLSFRWWFQPKMQTSEPPVEHTIHSRQVEIVVSFSERYAELGLELR